MATARGRFGGEPFGKKRFPLVFLCIPQTIMKLQGKKKPASLRVPHTMKMNHYLLLALGFCAIGLACRCTLV